MRETPTVPPATDLTSYIIFWSEMKEEKSTIYLSTIIPPCSGSKDGEPVAKVGYTITSPGLESHPWPSRCKTGMRASLTTKKEKGKWWSIRHKLCFLKKMNVRLTTSQTKLLIFLTTGITEGPADWDVDPNVWKFNDTDSPFAYVVMNYETFLTYTPLTTSRYEAFLLLL